MQGAESADQLLHCSLRNRGLCCATLADTSRPILNLEFLLCLGFRNARQGVDVVKLQIII